MMDAALAYLLAKLFARIPRPPPAEQVNFRCEEEPTMKPKRPMSMKGQSVQKATGQDAKLTPRRIFCTSFCNHGHDAATGRPVAHECYILPPAAFQAEREGDYETARRLIDEKRSRHFVKGR